MEILEVDNQTLAEDFLALPVRLYKDEPHWIRPLDKDIRMVFDPNQNVFFSHGECIRWIVRQGPKTVGRIAAFIDHKTSGKNDQPTGGIGFFESVPRQEVANLLFDRAKSWLAERGMEAMDGSINFGGRDKWWGILVSGFEHPPNYGMNYNFPYYKTLFEGYGFKEYFKQYTYYRSVSGGIDDTIRARAERLNRKGKFRFENLEGKDLHQVALDFLNVYNKAWANYQDVPPMTETEVTAMLKQIKPIMDRKLIWFGYYDKTPIAFAIMLPEVNQIFRHLNGKLGVLQQLKFWWMLRQGVCTKMVGVAFGIIPRFQRKGVESAMIEAIAQMAYDNKQKFGYVELEHNWVGDFNPQMMHVHEMMGGTIRKVHATYRYLFDRNKEFRRAPMVN